MLSNTTLTSLVVELDLKALYEVLVLPLGCGLTTVDPESALLLLDQLADPLGHHHLREGDVGVLGVLGGAPEGDLPTL